jgi:hypothetical protein
VRVEYGYEAPSPRKRFRKVANRKAETDKEVLGDDVKNTCSAFGIEDARTIEFYEPRE